MSARLLVPLAALVLLAAAERADAQSTREPHPYFEFQVERPVRVADGSPQPHYPDSLRAAKVEGAVLVQFVVDVEGRAEPASFKVLRSSDGRLSEAVREALPRMRFVPAEIGGRKVRQLIQQPFYFSATP